MTILGLAESFKTMNRPDPTVTLFDGLFLGNGLLLHSQFVLLEIGIESARVPRVCVTVVEVIRKCNTLETVTDLYQGGRGGGVGFIPRGALGSYAPEEAVL